MKTQYQRCQEFIKAHFGRMKKQEKSLFWQGWQAALGWHGHCKDCRFVKPDFSGCTAFRWEPCHMFEPKDPASPGAIKFGKGSAAAPGGILRARGKDKSLKTKLPGQWTRCPICDEWYEPYGERHKVHEHPEPQSGEPRDQWLASRLPYERWIVETTAGKAWVEWRKARGKGKEK